MLHSVLATFVEFAFKSTQSHKVFTIIAPPTVRGVAALNALRKYVSVIRFYTI